MSRLWPCASVAGRRASGQGLEVRGLRVYLLREQPAMAGGRPGQLMVLARRGWARAEVRCVVWQAILRAGGCNAVRGVRAPVGELQYIYSNSESVALVVETADLIARESRSLESRGLGSGLS